MKHKQASINDNQQYEWCEQKGGKAIYTMELITKQAGKKKVNKQMRANYIRPSIITVSPRKLRKGPAQSVPFGKERSRWAKHHHRAPDHQHSPDSQVGQQSRAQESAQSPRSHDDPGSTVESHSGVSLDHGPVAERSSRVEDEVLAQRWLFWETRTMCIRAPTEAEIKGERGLNRFYSNTCTFQKCLCGEAHTEWILDYLGL